MKIYFSDGMGVSSNALVCLLTIIPSLIGCGLLLAGLILHPLLVLTPKDSLPSSDRTPREISIWRVTANEETKTWQKFVGSPSPMPVEIASAMMIVAAIFSFSAFFK